MKKDNCSKSLIVALILGMFLFNSLEITTLAAEDKDKPVIVYDGESVEVGTVTIKDENTGVSANATEENASITVDGDVSVTNVSTSGESEITTGASSQSYKSEENKDASASIDVKGNIDVKADGGDGVSVDSSGDEMAASINVDGSITVNTNNDYANGIYNNANDGAQATVTAGGDISATSESNGTATGVFNYSDGSYAKVSVEGNINATSNGNAYGINNYSENKGISHVNIGKDVNVSGGNAYGIDNYTGNDSISNITIKGNVNAKSDEDYSSGVVSTGSGKSSIVIDGNIKSEAKESADGVSALSDGKNADINVTIGGDVTAITKRKDTNTAWGIFATNNGGKIHVDVGGNVKSDGTGIVSWDNTGLSSSSVRSGNNSFIVNGDVTGEVWGLELATFNTYNATEVFKHDFLIDGLLSGGDVAIFLDSDTIKGKNKGIETSITVWKVGLNKEGNVAEAVSDDTYVQEAVPSIEKTIKYIIKLDQPVVGGTLSVTDKNGKALNTSHGREIAFEGDKVLMKVNLDPGYRIIAAYNGDGTKERLTMDSNGNYYIVVPKGGGVYLSVELTNKKYNVTFVDDNGSLLQSDKMEYGDIPVYKGKVPKKEETTKYSYSFNGWNPEINPVTGDITYKATYEATIKSYDLLFDLAGGSLNNKTGKVSMRCEYGSIITLPHPTRNGYRFLYWKGSRYDAGDKYTVDGAHTFTAVWTKDETISDLDEKNNEKSPYKSPKTGDVYKGKIEILMVSSMLFAMASIITAQKK